MILLGCGERPRPIKKASRHSASKVRYESVNEQNLVQYPLVAERRNCFYSQVEGEEEVTKVTIFSGARERIRQVDDILAYQEIVHEFVVAEEEVLSPYESGARQLSAGHQFLPCFGLDYTRGESVNDQAMSALYPFYEIQKRIHHFWPKERSIKLRFLPKIQVTQSIRNEQDLSVHETKTKVNNAYYHYANQEIAFLPMAKTAYGRLPLKGVPFWKLPLVGAHEYGHHLFSKLMPRFMKEYKSRMQSEHGCFVEDSLEKKSSSHFFRLVDAFNEGFADLFAHMVLKEKGIDYKGLGCIEKDRMATSESFSDGTMKSLTKDVISRYFTGSSGGTSRPSCYQRVNLRDPHKLGAIFAHVATELLKHIDASEDEKMALIFQWPKMVNMEFDFLQSISVEESFVELTRLFVDKLFKSHALSERKFCRIIEKKIPILDYRDYCPSLWQRFTNWFERI